MRVRGKQRRLWGDGGGRQRPRYRVIDTETTGIDPREDAVVEVAWVDLEGDEVVGEASWLVDPGRPIPPSASAIHHITDDMVAGCPPLADVWPPADLDRVVLVAHNAVFDAPFLGVEPRSMVCTLRLARHLWPEAERHANQFLRYWLKLDVAAGPAHRALDDARVTAALFRRELAALGPDADPVAASWRPIEVTTMPFGKHRGRPLTEVPQGYLEWLLAETTRLDEDLAGSVRRELDRRRSR